MKQNSQEWFNGENVDEIKNGDKLFKNFRKSKLHVKDNDIYNAARYKFKKMVFKIKREHFFKVK